MAILLMNPMRAPPEAWVQALAHALPGEEVRLFPDIGDPHAVEVVIAGAGAKFADLPTLPNLKLIFSLLAGVEALLANPRLPDVPVVKVEPPGGDATMIEYCLTLVLYHHRMIPQYRHQQARHEWKPLARTGAGERTVGFLGFGTLGKPMAEKIRGEGFQVIAWARTPKAASGIEVYVGEAGFAPFLARTEIAVNMLPLTPATRGILNARTFSLMPRGASLINLARGGHVVDTDLIAALDSRQLGAATLDVTEPEPLPPDSPLWDHPGVTLLPHVARRPSLADSLPQIVENMRRLRSGEKLLQMVDRIAGY